MAVNSRSSDLCCIQIQAGLDAMMPNIKPSNFPYDGGIIASLKSPQNVGAFSISEPQAPGKGRPQATNNCIVELSYEQPFCDEVEDGCLDVCGDLPDRGDSMAYLGVTIDYQKSYGGEFTEFDFACLCETPDERLTKRIDQAMYNIEKAIGIHLAQLMFALVGSYSNGGSSNNAANFETLPLLNAGGYSNPAGLVKLFNEHRLQRSMGRPIVLGGLALENWMMVRTVGGLNGQHPIQPGDQTFGASIFTDLDFDVAIREITGDTLDHAISWSPGAFQLLEWYENTGYMEKFHEHYTYTTMTSSRGTKFDFYLRYNECTRLWQYVLCKAYDLFSLSEALYAPCIIGNHKLHWILDCAQFTCDDYYVNPIAAGS